MDCTCAELTGPGSDATAASKAFFMMPMVSGGKDAFEKSFISGQSARSVSRYGMADADSVGNAANTKAAKPISKRRFI